MMRSGYLLLGALCLALTPRIATAQALRPGSPAPALTVGAFVKGQPVRRLEKGKIYVVEFWATWCGPCRETAPHLSALQKKYPQVTVIGVSIWEETPAAVKPFVAAMGDKMAYRVALDQVPPGADPHQSKMSRAWMDAAGQDKIPTAFIVNGDGVVAWVGYPPEMDDPLAKVVAGKWDVKAAAARAQREAALAGQRRLLQSEFQAAGDDPARLLKVIDKAIRIDPEAEKALGVDRVNLLLATGNPQGAVRYGRRLLATTYKSNAEALNALAWRLVNPKVRSVPPRAVATLALDAALQADALTKAKHPIVANTLARAYFVTGNPRKALETQRRAVQQSKGTKLDGDPELAARLAEYERAAR